MKKKAAKEELESQPNKPGQNTSARIPALIFALVGGLGFLGLLAIAIAIPDPTINQFFIFRVVLALAAGMFAAAIPGTLSVRFTARPKVAISATGAIGVFVIIYFLNPPLSIAPPPTGNQIRSFLRASPEATNWIEVARQARESGAISELSPIPVSVNAARSEFESWWTDTPLSQKERIDSALLFEALSLDLRIYRVTEIESTRKPSSFKWADEIISFFEDEGDKKYIVEGLLEKAAIYLDLSDIAHTDPDLFQRVASDGDQLMSRASGLANQEQQAEVYRLWSRFFYNLSRPRTGDLDSDWDNNYLLVAYNKISAAVAIQPAELKNITELARVTMKFAACPLQEHDPIWTKRLREAQTLLANRWKTANTEINDPRSRMSPLDTLGVITTETVMREWLDMPVQERTIKCEGWLEELSETAIPALAETIVLVKGSELESKYTYDLHYDLARTYAERVILLDTLSSPQADVEMDAALSNLEAAIQSATQLQRQAAAESLAKQPCFTNLPTERMRRLKSIFEKS